MSSQGPAVTLRDAQQAVDEWIGRFEEGYWPPLSNLARLIEEVGELARLMVRKYGEQSFKPGEEEGEIGDELADILWVVVCLANQTGVDLESAVRENLNKKTRRDGTRHRDNPKLQG